MCIRCTKYPLVWTSEDLEKRKVLFSYGFDIENFNDFENYKKVNRSINKRPMLELYYPYLQREFDKNGYIFDKFVSVPCGQCTECLNQKAKDWTMRILYETKSHEFNYFITLTYDDDHIPYDGSLIKSEISDFNKKLKVYLERKGWPSDFRFYGVGEYGGETFRPHYHIMYFGLDLKDLAFETTDENGNMHFSSEFLKNTWSKGLIDIEEVDFGNAAYIARYSEKKQLLTKAEKQKFREAGFEPEFSVMSRRPGIGSELCSIVSDNVKNGVFHINIKGRNYSIPMYVKRKLELDDSDYLEYNNDIEDILIQQRLSLSLITNSNAIDIRKYIDDNKFALKKVRGN